MDFVFLVWLVLVLALVAGIPQVLRELAAARASILDGLADELTGVERSEGSRRGLAGDYQGRRVQVAARPGGRWVVRARVEAPPPDFTIAPLTNRRRLARWAGLVRDPKLADRVADDRFVLSSPDAARTAPLFARDGLAPRLDRLFGATVGAKGVRLRDGWLEVDYGDMVGRDPGALERSKQRAATVLRDAAALAALCERRQITVGGAQAIVFGWTGGSEAVRCPFCHAGLGDPSEPEVACETCRTLHHAGCFDEAGGCTVFGCEGRAARRQLRA